jgi:hypothetical protein
MMSPMANLEGGHPMVLILLKYIDCFDLFVSLDLICKLIYLF